MKPSKVLLISHKKLESNGSLLPFEVVADPSQADIVASEMNDGSRPCSRSSRGSQTNLLTKQFISVTVRLNH